jgi:hypothetical protein
MMLLPILLALLQVQKNNGPAVLLINPAHPGDYLSLYGTYSPGNVSVSVAGLPVPVTYAGANQINVFLPPDLAAPDSCYDALVIDTNRTVPHSLCSSPTASPKPSL